MSSSTDSKRVASLKSSGVYRKIMWHEEFKENHPGYFERNRADIESETVEQLLDRWCRGNNLVGFAPSILNAVDAIRKACKL
jgi:hypothetical protein